MRNHENVVSKVLGFLVIFGLSVGVSLSSSRNQRENKSTKSQDVGTVLFDADDLEKTCWSDEELILIISRTVFQNMLPEANMLDYGHDEYVDLFMEYVNICLEAVQQLTQKKLKHLVSKALADTIGGYLRVYLLPNTKRSYYAGNIKFQKAKKLFDLYDEFRIFLRSSGDGWNQPIEFHSHMNIAKIDIPVEKNKNDCAGIILYHGVDGSVSIPMPILDDSQHPTSIALPFESENLCSLFSEKSAFILVKYFTDGSKCLASTSLTMGLEKFQQQLYHWIHQSVNPHLMEETWYPAFGGVLRIINTLEAKGHSPSSPKHNVNHSHNFQGHKKHKTNSFGGHNSVDESNEKCGINKFLVVVIVCIFLIWLLLGIIFVTCRLLKNTSSEDTTESFEQGNYKIDDLYENTKYPSHGNSSVCEGGLLKKFKARNKYRDCGCSDDDDDESSHNDGDYTNFSSENELKRQIKNNRKGKKRRDYNLSSSPR